jgi:hypothetical protein
MRKVKAEQKPFPPAKAIVEQTCKEGASGLVAMSPNGTPPQSRVKDAKAAHDIYKKFFDADRTSAWQRKLIQEMYDGAPPYDQDQLKSLGQGHRFNINLGGAAAKKEAALAAYNDIADSVETMIRVSMREDIDPTERTEKQQIIAEEYHRLHKDAWGEFDFSVQQLAEIFIAHGVSFAYREDPVDWRWKVTGLGDFLIPRRTRATENDIKVAFATRDYGVDDLYAWVKDPVTSRNLGWERDEVIKAIVRACYGDKGLATLDRSWERFEEEVKNNDLGISEAHAETVKVNHMWVREYDGTVQHCITDANGLSDKFFYVCPEKYESMQRWVHGFTFGIGNGFYHGIRGQGYKIYPQEQASNRLYCGILDSTFLSLSMLVQPADMDDLVTMSLVNFGAVTALPPEMQIVEQKFQSKTQEALAVAQNLSIQIQDNTGQYQSTPVDSAVLGRDRVTKAEVLGRAETRGSLSASSMNLFYQPWQRLHRESFRRLQNKDYRDDQPGGKERAEFLRRCRERGVTLADIQAVQDVEIVRSVGAGSPSLRRMMLDDLLQFLGALDEVGRNNLLRDKIAQNVGYSQVDRYLPRIQQKRPVIDERLAELENADLRMGVQIKISISDVHAVHAGIHLLGMQETLQELQAQQVDPPRALQHFQVAIPHTEEHLAAFAEDQTRADVHASMADLLNQFANLAKQLANNIREVQIAQEKAKRDVEVEQAQNGGQPGQEMTPETQARVQSILAISQAKIQAMQAENAVMLQGVAQAAQQKLAIDDLANARKIANAAREKQAGVVAKAA